MSSPKSFHTTRWSLIVQASADSSPEARQAMEELCRLYWYPLYAFARREGFDPEEAEDATQGFFVSLLEREDLRAVSEEKGRFRSFLRTAMKHFLLNARRAQKTLKRGGGRRVFSIDRELAESRYSNEPSVSMTSEKLFDRQWALTILDAAMTRLEGEYASNDKSRIFELLKPTLTGAEEFESYRGLGNELGMKEGSIRNAAYRMRKEFQQHLREIVSETLEQPTVSALDDEINRLFSALSG